MAKIPVESHVALEETTSTVMSPDIEFVGSLKFKSSLMVKGRVKGTIDAEGHLIVAPNAVVEASVKAARITNFGAITGDVAALECVEMKSGARQTGDVSTPDIMIENGCRLNGAVRMEKT